LPQLLTHDRIQRIDHSVQAHFRILCQGPLHYAHWVDLRSGQ
jgi:hypothetical protein